MSGQSTASKKDLANSTVDVLEEIAAILNCQLDRRTISICISMIEHGVNPEALASVVKELRRSGQEARAEMAERQPAQQRR